MATTEERFWKFVRKDDDGCWRWTSAVSPRYGVFWVGGSKRSMYAHRYAYELLVGPIPEGLQIDHLCENRLCVNPAHLEPTDGRTNTLRASHAPAAINAAKTHCAKGHPFDGDNLVMRGSRRRCRTCERTRARLNARTRRAQRGLPAKPERWMK